MNIARILYPVTVLGPGKRIGIWVAGCSRACPECSNPELWERRPEYEISVDSFIKLIQVLAEKNTVDGFTISGGEPFDQALDMAQLLDKIMVISRDILVYTGYSMEALRAQQEENVNKMLESIAVVIDGPYIAEQNNNTILRGSANQKIHILEPAFVEKYEKYLSTATNQIQNFTTTDGIISVGIHRKSFSHTI